MVSEEQFEHAEDFINALSARGQHSFTTSEVGSALGTTPASVKQSLNRLRRQRKVASPMRGFYVIVPPEYQSLQCLPAEQFVPALMDHVQQPYYVGLLSAAQYHGAAHQRPQAFQVMVSQPRRSISCGRVRVDFFVRRNLTDIPVHELNTPRGVIRISSPEATAVDLVGYQKQAGGLDQVATVLSELAESIDPSRLAIAAHHAPVTWAQRLGFLMELVDEPEAAAALKPWVREAARDYTMLRANRPESEMRRDADWKIIVNADVEPDL